MKKGAKQKNQDILLFEWRLLRGLEQTHVANALGVSQALISMLEKGNRPATESLKKKFKEVYGAKHFSRILEFKKM